MKTNSFGYTDADTVKIIRDLLAAKTNYNSIDHSLLFASIYMLVNPESADSLLRDK